jgi:hypothetical protein
MAESEQARPTAQAVEFTAQVERRPDGSLVTVLYRDGQRVHEQLVRSLRQGKRRAYDLLCTAVDTAGVAFPASEIQDRVELPQQYSPSNWTSERDPKVLIPPRVTVVWSAHAGAH